MPYLYVGMAYEANGSAGRIMDNGKPAHRTLEKEELSHTNLEAHEIPRNLCLILLVRVPRDERDFLAYGVDRMRLIEQVMENLPSTIDQLRRCTYIARFDNIGGFHLPASIPSNCSILVRRPK